MAASTTSTNFAGKLGAAFPNLGAALGRHWWAVLLRGVIAIAFGLIALALPGATLLSLVFIFAGYTLADGVLALFAIWPAARANQPWGYLVLEGVANIAVALVAAFWPGLTVAVLVVVMGIWAIVSGALMLASAFRLHTDHGRWWLVLGGVASLLFGIALILAPLLGALVFTWWIGAYAFVFGVSLIMLAFRLRRLKPDAAT